MNTRVYYQLFGILKVSGQLYVTHSTDYRQGNTASLCQRSSSIVTLFCPTHEFQPSTLHHTLRELQMLSAITIPRQKWADNYTTDVCKRIINSIINGVVSELNCLEVLHYVI